MTASVAPYLYTEARLNIEPTYHNSILQISTEPTGLFGSRKRARADDGDGDQDEEAYAKRHLATESSIFFRRRTRSPRAFVWRILDDGRQLELQCVDLVQGRRNTHESVLSFRLQFAHAIRANGVAFADPDQHDALDVFVLTTANELFTFALSKADLLRATVPVSSAEWDPKACWKCFKPASFSFKFPYRLVSASSLELFVSLHDGGILRLNRKPGDNGMLSLALFLMFLIFLMSLLLYLLFWLLVVCVVLVVLIFSIFSIFFMLLLLLVLNAPRVQCNHLLTSSCKALRGARRSSPKADGALRSAA